jgi:hypothetical protein
LAGGGDFNDGNGISSGHVRVFEWNSAANQWEQRGPDLDGEAAFDEFGWSVALSADGNVLAGGGVFNDGNGDDSGHVRVFEWQVQ